MTQRALFIFTGSAPTSRCCRRLYSQSNALLNSSPRSSKLLCQTQLSFSQYSRNFLVYNLQSQKRRGFSHALTSGRRYDVANYRVYCTQSTPNKSQSYTQRIKVILKEYGGVGVIFHTVISLFSLGTCYLLVDNGLDVQNILKYFNVESSDAKKGASTFAIAYLLHKCLLPIRATITIVSVPVIVRQLRARGWMKGTVNKVKNSMKLNKRQK